MRWLVSAVFLISAEHSCPWGFSAPCATRPSTTLNPLSARASFNPTLAGCVGHRLDGWPNPDLNVGAIIALAPELSSVANLLSITQMTVRSVLNTWGPGKFDAELFLDGKA